VPNQENDTLAARAVVHARHKRCTRSRRFRGTHYARTTLLTGSKDNIASSSEPHQGHALQFVRRWAFSLRFRPSTHSFSSRDFLGLPPTHSFILHLRGQSPSCHDERHLKEEVGNEEAQQTQQRDNLHRDAAGAGSFCRKSALSRALLSAARDVSLPQAGRGLLL
jgi:hypothetical protein